MSEICISHVGVPHLCHVLVMYVTGRMLAIVHCIFRYFILYGELLVVVMKVKEQLYGVYKYFTICKLFDQLVFPIVKSNIFAFDT